MKYCNKCGSPLAEGAKFCTGCGNKIEQKIANEPTTNNKPEDNKAANKLGIISLCLYFGGEVVSFILSMLFSFLVSLFVTASNNTMSGLYTGFTILLPFISLGMRIAAYVIMIIMRVKYPKNTFGKVLMWVYIGLLILTVLIIVGFLLLLLVISSQVRY